MNRHKQPRPYVREVDVYRMTKPQLVAVYNHLSRDFPVQDFAFWSTAVRRVIRLLEANEQVVVDHDTGSPDATRVLPNIWVAHRDSVPPAPPRSETRWRDGMVITVLATTNPKREGSASWQRWHYMESGITIGEYLARCEAGGHGSHWRGDIIWALERDFIALEEDGQPVVLPPAYTDL